jgi:hypothetical protein
MLRALHIDVQAAQAAAQVRYPLALQRQAVVVAGLAISLFMLVQSPLVQSPSTSKRTGARAATRRLPQTARVVVKAGRAAGLSWWQAIYQAPSLSRPKVARVATGLRLRQPVAVVVAARAEMCMPNM